MSEPIDYRSTGKQDRHGNTIRLGDMLRCWDGKDYYTAKVVFLNCAFRAYPLTTWCGEPVKDAEYYLQFNQSLIFNEILGTSWLEVL